LKHFARSIAVAALAVVVQCGGDVPGSRCDATARAGYADVRLILGSTIDRAAFQDFVENNRLSYRLPAGGKVRFLSTDVDGREIYLYSFKPLTKTQESDNERALRRLGPVTGVDFRVPQLNGIKPEEPDCD
jgi:hypothetical protein